MIIWNFRTPITFIASLMWNFCEYFEISLGRFAPIIFRLVIETKKKNYGKSK